MRDRSLGLGALSLTDLRPQSSSVACDHVIRVKRLSWMLWALKRVDSTKPKLQGAIYEPNTLSGGILHLAPHGWGFKRYGVGCPTRIRDTWHARDVFLMFTPLVFGMRLTPR